MKDFLLDAPFWLPALLVLTGIALFLAGRARRESKLKLASLVCILLALLLVALSYFAPTDKKQVLSRTRQFISALEQRDFTTLDRLLAPSARLYSLNHGQIVNAARRYASEFDLKSVRVNSLDIEDQQPEMIVDQLSITSHQNAKMMFESLPTSWRLTWIKTRDGWLLADIRATRLLNQDGSTVEQYINDFPR